MPFSALFIRFEDSGVLFQQQQCPRDLSGIYGTSSWSGLRIPWHRGECMCFFIGFTDDALFLFVQLLLLGFHFGFQGGNFLSLYGQSLRRSFSMVIRLLSRDVRTSSKDSSCSLICSFALSMINPEVQVWKKWQMHYFFREHRSAGGRSGVSVSTSNSQQAFSTPGVERA